MDPSQLPLAERHPPIRWIVERFQLNLDALRELLDEAVPHIEALDEKRLAPDALAALRTLPPDRQEKLRELVAERLEAAVTEQFPPPGPEQEAADTGESTSEAEASPSEKVEVTVKLELAALNDIFEGDQHLVGSFVQGIYRNTVGPSRLSIIHNSLLAMAIGALEVLISGLITHFYVRHPAALDNETPHFSLSDLRRFGDVDDAADALIAHHVSDVMFGNLDDWAKWFRDVAKSRIDNLAEFEIVREAVQRRHVIMHNGGLVSREYLSRVQHVGDPPVLGSRLTVDSDYLRTILDELDVLGTALGTLAWGTWHKDERDLSAMLLLNRTYQLMLMERWRAVEGLSSLGARLQCPTATSLALQCNHWLSIAELRGTTEIQTDIENWDTSALSGRFRLVRLVLLGALDDSLTLAEELVGNGEISWGELHEWPILRTLREHGGFAELSARIGFGQGQPGQTDNSTMDR